MVFLNQYDQEVFTEYGEWLPYIIDIYSTIRDSETGDFRFLPFEGTVMDQPYKSILILKEIQNTYREVANEKSKEMIEKAKANRR